MRISYNWLKTYINTDLPPADVADKLTLTGLEVEQTEQIGNNLDRVLVGHILDVKDHPNADRLRVCRVDLGDREVQIVCGAENVAAGQHVPVATVGSELPGNPAEKGKTFRIKKAKLRGVESEGMICAEDELGLGEDHSGIMVLAPGLSPGTPLQEALGLENDTVFEIGLTPNRPDAACHIGTARDLSAVTGTTLQNPYNYESEETDSLDDEIDISIRDQDKCHRYVAKIVDDVTVGPSPIWLQNRLKSIGLRPVNNVVDVTNFVMHEIGQPLHAFDYTRLGGQQIVVQSYDEEKIFKTLDGTERKVQAGTLFICDGNGPVAIAGIMGGLDSEVTDATTKVLIESAWFAPESIRRSSRKTGLQTDASYRYERGVDPEITRRAAERAADMIAELAGGKVFNGCSDVHPVITQPKRVNLRISRINQLLGTEISQDTASDILTRLEISNSSESDDILQCTIPAFRPDITREVDLIEEVGRIFDYNNIPQPEFAPFHTPSPLSRWEVFDNMIRSAVARLRYKEITTNSLLSQGEAEYFSEADELIRTLNPVSSEATTLRPALIGGFLRACNYNLNRNARQLRFFEVGHVYRRHKKGTWVEGIEEHSRLMMGICGFRVLENWQEQTSHFTVFDLKSDLEALFHQLGISDSVTSSLTAGDELSYSLDKQSFASISPVNKSLSDAFDINLPAIVAEVDLSLLFHLDRITADRVFEPVSKFPPFSFDAAFTVGREVTAGELADLIRQTAGDILESLEVFDVYEGENLEEGKKSIAFRLTFSDRNKTLTIKDVEPVVQKISKMLANKTGAKLRS